MKIFGSWAFAENKQIEGNAKIIRLICRDENIHLAATQMLIRLLKKEDPDFAQIAVDMHDTVQSMFLSALEQEKGWTDYLFHGGSIVGLNADILKQYLEWLCSKRMGAVGIKCPYTSPKNNPLPWTESWIAGSSVQVAPQETEISSYVIGGIKNDVDSESLKGFSLD